jgi:hypothetical protein
MKFKYMGFKSSRPLALLAGPLLGGALAMMLVKVALAAIFLTPSSIDTTGLVHHLMGRPSL